MIFPINQYGNLLIRRPEILIPENSLLPLTNASELALHPKMAKAKIMHDEGRMAILHSTHYDNPNRSHFRSTDIYTSGVPTSVISTGWLGRMFERIAPNFPDLNVDTTPKAVSVFPNKSATCRGTNYHFAESTTDPSNVYSILPGGGEAFENSERGRQRSYVRSLILQNNVFATTMRDAYTAGANQYTNYPSSSNRLANALKIIARLIHGGLQTPVFNVYVGGFDNHANQVIATNKENGNHPTLLDWISEGVFAFYEDLALMGKADEVMAMTFSEFGRRIQSNASSGTDHGDAGPMLLFGNHINQSNLVMGDTPTVSSTINVSEGVAKQHDFTRVYNTFMNEWFEDTSVTGAKYPLFDLTT